MQLGMNRRVNEWVILLKDIASSPYRVGRFQGFLNSPLERGVTKWQGVYQLFFPLVVAIGFLQKNAFF